MQSAGNILQLSFHNVLSYYLFEQSIINLPRVLDFPVDDVVDVAEVVGQLLLARELGRVNTKTASKPNSDNYM